MKKCPWCGSDPSYKVVTWNCNYDSNGNMGDLKDRRTEIIECSNLKCEVRPKLVRVETGDAEEIWDNRQDDNSHGCKVQTIGNFTYVDLFGGDKPKYKNDVVDL